MPITNTTKITSSVTNSAKVASFETWATISTTWASEVRYWEDTSSVFTNTAISGQSLWSSKLLPWRITAPWQTVGNFISNIAKPL